MPRHTSTTRLSLHDGTLRAHINSANEPIVYGASRADVLPTTLDHIIAAVGACMFETLARALNARKVDLDPTTFAADVEGTIEGPPKRTDRITGIHVRYTLDIPATQRPLADRALRFHPRGCPVHETLKHAVPITWSATITEHDGHRAAPGTEPRA